MKRIAKRILALISALAVMMTLSSCALIADKVNAVELSADYTPSDFTPSDVKPSFAAVDFALRLLAGSADGDDTKNGVVISPYSALCALALLANGAAGDTLSEMETALGMTTSELNDFLPSYTASLVSTEKSRVTSANSIWMRNEEHRLHVYPSFLQKNADLYGANVFSAPFDAGTLSDINKWISKNTDGQIQNMLDEIPDEAVMYLINAVLLDAEWDEIYKKDQVRDGVFTNADGKDENVKMMYDGEGTGFVLDGAVGLLRKYAGGSYEFVAILPDEGVAPEEYLGTLDGETLIGALSGEKRGARTAIPKFSLSTKTDFVSVLSDLGMKSVFDYDSADLSALGYSDFGPIYVSRILHNAVISVDERGTKAGAATVVEITDCTAADIDTINVYLDRPFIFFINDTATHTPVFCGIVNSVG